MYGTARHRTAPHGKAQLYHVHCLALVLGHTAVCTVCFGSLTVPSPLHSHHCRLWCLRGPKASRREGSQQWQCPTAPTHMHVQSNWTGNGRPTCGASKRQSNWIGYGRPAEDNRGGVGATVALSTPVAAPTHHDVTLERCWNAVRDASVQCPWQVVEDRVSATRQSSRGNLPRVTAYPLVHNGCLCVAMDARIGARCRE